MIEAAFSGGAAALTTGAILTVFALHLGASNATVGTDLPGAFLRDARLRIRLRRAQATEAARS